MKPILALLAAAAIAVALLVERWTRPGDDEWWGRHVPDPRDSSDDAGDGAWWQQSVSTTPDTHRYIVMNGGTPA